MLELVERGLAQQLAVAVIDAAVQCADGAVNLTNSGRSSVFDPNGSCISGQSPPGVDRFTDAPLPIQFAGKGAVSDHIETNSSY